VATSLNEQSGFLLLVWRGQRLAGAQRSVLIGLSCSGGRPKSSQSHRRSQGRRSAVTLAATPENSLDPMTDSEHVVLIHGTWGSGDTLSDARRAFEERGFTVHTPTLHYHELPIDKGAQLIAPLSLRDYADDVVALVDFRLRPDHAIVNPHLSGPKTITSTCA